MKVNFQGVRKGFAGQLALRFVRLALLFLFILCLPSGGTGQGGDLLSPLPSSLQSTVGNADNFSSGTALDNTGQLDWFWFVVSPAFVLVLLVVGFFYLRGVRRHQAELQWQVSLKNDALARLNSSERLLRELAGNNNAVFFVCDADYATVQYLSPAFEKWWGIPVRELCEHPSAWMEAVHPDDLARVSDELQRFRDQSPTSDHLIGDYRIISPDGRLRWVQTRFHPVLDREGGVERLCGLVEDITEQMQARGRLDLLLRDHRAIIDNVRDIIVKLSDEGRILWCNKRLADLTARAEANLIGESVLNLVHERDRGILASVLRLTRKIDEGEAEVRIRTPAGYSLYLLSTVRQAADDGRPEAVVCIGRDITYHRQAELETIELHRQLQHAQKMEAIGSLTGGIAHDFNNILSSILGYADLARLSADKGATTKIKEYLQEVVLAGKLASDLVEKMLTFTRKHSEDHNARITLPQGLHEVIKVMRPMLPGGISIHIDADRRPRRVAISDVDFQQVIMNLLINARDAMLDKGNIQVDCRVVEVEAMACSSCRHSFSGSYMRISITDHGYGIAEENLDKIFHPFFTTKPQGKGTGLGLSIVHGIMHSRHGHIRVGAGPEGGSMFELYLCPAGMERQHRVRHDQVRPASGRPQPGHNRILLVDDEVKVGRNLKKMLQENGYLVDYRTDPVDALNMYSNLPANFDLVITDQTMPHITGMDLARHVKHLQPDCPVILCTGFSDTLNHQQLDEFSIPLCQKPLDNRVLLDHISRLLH